MAKKETRKTTTTGSRRGQSAKGTTELKKSAREEETMNGGGAATAVLPFTHEQIADRAKQIWAQRGYPQGQDEQNWREAERQLSEETGIGSD